MNSEEVKNLAALARLEISENEAENLATELVAILDYVKEVKNVSGGEGESRKSHLPLRNIFRLDDNAHEAGQYTEALLGAAPSREGNYLKVKKIM